MDRSLYKDTYRVGSTRLPYRDYRSCGWYFVTICTKDKQHFFGAISAGSMVLSTVGSIAEESIHTIPLHFLHTVVDSYIIMPNHLHVILVITDSIGVVETCPVVETRHGVSLPKRSFGKPIAGSLGTIINQYKGSVTRFVRKQLGDTGFARQSGYYEHIIRNEQSLDRIRQYITDNPTKRENDEMYLL